MAGGIWSIVLPVGTLLFAAGFAYSLTRTRAEDPKLKLLDSLLRLAGGEETDSRERHAA